MLIRVDAPEIVDAARVEIDRDAAAAFRDDGAPELEALQDRLLPFAGGALADLQMGGHVLDCAQELEVNRD
jgi:hypothetical protein